MTLTSDEVNFLIYRYLLESGFVHSAFCFGNESHIAKSKIVGGDVPPGSLISFLQKGLQHTEIECHVNDDGTETLCDAPFSLVTKHECNIKSKTKLFDPDVPMDEDYGSLEISRELTSHYKGHNDTVFTCAVNPNGDMLVSGSQDCTARLWQHIEDPSRSRCLNLLEKQPSSAAIHLAQWSPNGSMFAVASLTGDCWIFTSDGASRHNLPGHTSPITAIKWSPDGQYLLSCSLDSTVAVWNAANGHIVQQWRFNAGVLDADWRNGSTFACGVADQAAYICEMEKEQPVAAFCKHTGDVNCVKWDPSGNLLATCSDDATVKVWSPQKSEALVLDITGHGRDICCIAWGAVTHERHSVQVLASASFDCTVRIWNAANGSCLLVLSKHLHPIISLSFNRSGDYLACVSHDRVFIWSTNDGVLLKTFKAGGGVNCISWLPNSDAFVIATANNALINVRFRP